MPDDPNVLPSQAAVEEIYTTGFDPNCGNQNWSINQNGAPGTTAVLNPTTTVAGDPTTYTLTPGAQTAPGVYTETLTASCTGDGRTSTDSYTVGFANVQVFDVPHPGASDQGTTVVGKTLKAVAGQHVQLVVAVATDSSFESLASPMPVPTQQWNVPGAVTGYPYIPGSAATSPVVTPNQIDFYWLGAVSKQNLQVGYSIRGNFQNDPYASDLIVNVSGPSLISWTSQTISENINPPNSQIPTESLSFGFFPVQDYHSLGIVEYYNAKGAAGGGRGQFAVIQVVNNSTVTSNLGSTTQQGYDTCIIYPDQTIPLPTVTAAAMATASAYDAPVNGLPDNESFVTVNNSFTDYLTYRPQGADSMRVTLGVLNWNTLDTAKNASYPSPTPTSSPYTFPAGQWSISSTSNSMNPTGVAATTLPLFTGEAIGTTTYKCIPY